MFSILIIDDEQIITEGIRFLIEHGTTGYCVLDVAYNGADGYDLAMDLKPDILIVDIHLPQIDGLEMIRMLKQSKLESEFIILSGYTEFDYAKRAMSLGVEFYLTKPVEDEELYAALQKAGNSLTVKRENKAELQTLKEIVEANEKKMKRFVVRDILDSAGENIESVRYRLDMLRYPSQNHYVCALIEFMCESEALRPEVIKRIINKIEHDLLSPYSVTAIQYSTLQIATLISHHENIDYAAVLQGLKALKDYAVNMLKITSSIGVGLIHENENEISTSFEEARHSLDYKVIKGENSVISYYDVIRISSTGEFVSSSDIRRLERYIDNMDVASSVRQIEKIFNNISGSNALSLNDLQMQCMNILLLGLHNSSPIQSHLNEFLGKNILNLENISRFKTLEELKNWLSNTIRSVIELKAEYQIPVQQDLVSEIKEYIEDNLEKDISLTMLADRFFMNPSYLSQLFKLKTGDTYLNFLTTLRMNKAKDLLINTDMKIYNICHQVGYRDNNYFSKLFEKYTGYKPSEYKKKHSQFTI